MPSDHEAALAFAARREGKRAMTAARWSHLLSLGLGWMNPGQARAFVDAGVRAGLLAADGDLLRLVIDPQAVEVPRGFRPRPEAAPAPHRPTGTEPRPAEIPSPRTQSAPPEPDPFLAWLARLAAHTGKTREQVLGQVSALQESMGGLLTAEAAVLLLARKAGLAVAEDAARAAQLLEGRSRPARPVKAAAGPAAGAAGPAPSGTP